MGLNNSRIWKNIRWDIEVIDRPYIYI